MFLALKEMSYSKLRYSLIIGIMFLISLMVFMLSGLANGLSQEFSQVVNDWNAKSVVLTNESNRVLSASQLTLKDLDAVDSSKKAPLSIYSGALALPDSGEKDNISIFGTEKDAFFLPKLSSGRSFESDSDIIISENIADKGYKLGDKMTIGSDNTELTVVGIFPTSYYLATPVLYTTTKTATILKFGKETFKNNDNYPINAVLSDADKTTLTDDKLDKMSSQTFIESLPGYTEQKLTLDAMIYFLFVIAVAIIGIFMYVITLQKTAVFGVMKVQGISNTFISKAIVAQSFLVGVIGVAIAGVLSYAIQFVLPEAMPFAVNLTQWIIYGIVLIVMSIIGGVFSIITVKKVDPINAIGG